MQGSNFSHQFSRFLMDLSILLSNLCLVVSNNFQNWLQIFQKQIILYFHLFKLIFAAGYALLKVNQKYFHFLKFYWTKTCYRNHPYYLFNPSFKKAFFPFLIPRFFDFLYSKFHFIFFKLFNNLWIFLVRVAQNLIS